VQPVQLELKAHQALVPLALKEHLALVPLVPEYKVHQVQLVLKVPPELELLVLVLQVLKVFKVHLVPQEYLVHLDLETLVQLV
jgi:hypothetical protein